MSNTGIIAKKAPPQEPIPEGVHIARCYQMIHIGTVEQTYKKGAEPKKVNLVRLIFEFPEIMRVFKEGEDERPMSLGIEFTLSTSKKANLRKFLESWRGKAFSEKEADAFDVTKLIGKACQMSVIHKQGEGENSDKTYANYSAVMPVMKGTPTPEPYYDQLIFNYGDKFSVEVAKELPDFIKDKIMKSDEWKIKTEELKGIEAKPAETSHESAEEAGEEVPF